MSAADIADSPTHTMAGDDADLNRIAPMSDHHDPGTGDLDADERDAASDRAIADVEGQLSALFNRVRSNWRDYATSVHPELQPPATRSSATSFARARPTPAYSPSSCTRTRA